MNKYTGRCRGGPEDGKTLAHWQTVKTYFKPMMAFSLQMDGNERVEAVPIGAYHWRDGVWLWIASSNCTTA